MTKQGTAHGGIRADYLSHPRTCHIPPVRRPSQTGTYLER